MKKAVFLLCTLLCTLLCALALTACGGEAHSELEGRYLQAADGTALIVTDDGSPVTLSDQSEDGGLFDGLNTGDRIRITCDDIRETDPGQTGAYTCKLLEEGALADIPEDALTTLEELGWDFGRHAHAPAEEPETAADPVAGYCGNTVTEVTLDGETYSFWGGDSVALTDILVNLTYDPDRVCRCPVEFTVDTEFGDGCGVNLAESFARCEAGQAALTAEQTEAIRDILARNCGGVTVTAHDPETGRERTFSCVGADAVHLRDLLGSLDYESGTCDCLPEYTVETAPNASYGVDLAGAYARFEESQTELTEKQTAEIRDIFSRNDGI